MLGSFRGLISTWPARLFFLLLAGAFAFWGVANKNPFGGDTTKAARVAGRDVAAADIQTAYRQLLTQATRSQGGGEPSPELRRAVAQQAIERTVTKVALDARTQALGIVVPDAALRDAVFAIPAFQDKAGKFDRNTMQVVLRNNGLTEPRMLDLVRSELAERQLLGAVQAGTTAPDALVRQVYLYAHETRVAEVVELPFAAAPAPPTPTDAQLHRWYDNHQDSYRAPEYRHVKAVVLTPETAGRDIKVTEDELRAAYEQHKGEFQQPERRSVQAISGLASEDVARRLAAQWSGGADWAAMQLAARGAGGNAVELNEATRASFPAPELGDAAFAAAADTVAPPVHSALGWFVVRVTHVTPGVNRSFESVRDTLRSGVQAQKAADLIPDRASRIDDMLAGGTKLDELPGDLGLAAATGTLDAAGNTASGAPAPIPGPPELRAAVIQATFAAHVGDAPKLTQAPGTQSYFAVSLDSITPPAPRPYQDVADRVLADWQNDQRRRAQDAAAADLMTQVQKGGNLSSLASAHGLQIRRLPPLGRDDVPQGVAPQLVAPLFGLRQGEVTMVETPNGFTVAQLAAINRPDPAGDKAGMDQLRQNLSQSIEQDVQASFVSAVRDAGNPQVNPGMLADLSQTGE